MNKIGFNALVWSAGMSEKMFPIIDRLKEIGYDGVEFFVGDPDVSAYKKVGDYAKSAGMETTAVFVMGKDVNPIDPSASVRAKGLEQIKWNLNRIYELNARVVCGPIHSAHTVFANHPAQDEEYKWSAEVLHAAGEYASQAGITIALEAVNRFECYLANTMEQLSRLVKEVNHESVRAMFDTHHANIEEKKLSDAIRTIKPYLAHVHISENDRGTPGDGHVPFDDAFAALAEINYGGWLTIEAFSRNDPDFANAIGVWREYSLPWDIAEKGYQFIKDNCVKHGLHS